MNPPDSLDSLFRDAVAAIDAGDVPALQRMVATHPELVSERLDDAGPWLRDGIGKALDGFFQRPYLLWFVAEDPVRNGRLPANIAEVAGAIIRAAWSHEVASLPEQLDYALRLVAWSWIARESGVQIALLDVLLDAGATPGETDNALVNQNVAAAEHLIARGAPVTLATALCLGRWDEVTRLAATADPAQKTFGLVLAALNGRAAALSRMVELGADVNAPSRNLYSHGTPLHHAVCSGSLESVRVLADAGAMLDTKDAAWGATPLDWAEYYLSGSGGDRRGKEDIGIAEYLRTRMAATNREGIA
jgi:hypothetical protein